MSLCASLCTCGNSDTKDCSDATCFRLGFVNGLDSPNQIAAQRLDELLAEKLANYRIEIYPGGQLGGERDMIESVQLGTLDMTITATTPLTNVVPGMGAGELAYLISMLEGLLGSVIVDIEMGNCKGLGEYRLLGAVNAPSDETYFEVLRPYVSRGRSCDAGEDRRG